MKSIALLCLLALSSAASAQTATIDAATGATGKSTTQQAVVNFELLETKNKRTTLLTSGGIKVDIGDQAPVKATVKNFTDGFDGDTQGAVVVREQAYVQQATTKTVFNEQGVATEETELTPGVVAEGFRAQAALTQPEGQALTGKLFVDLRKIKKIRDYTFDGKTIQLPDVDVATFDVNLKEGESTQTFDNYTIKTKVNKLP